MRQKLTCCSTILTEYAAFPEVEHWAGFTHTAYIQYNRRGEVMQYYVWSMLEGGGGVMSLVLYEARQLGLQTAYLTAF